LAAGFWRLGGPMRRFELAAPRKGPGHPRPENRLAVTG